MDRRISTVFKDGGGTLVVIWTTGAKNSVGIGVGTNLNSDSPTFTWATYRTGQNYTLKGKPSIVVDGAGKTWVVFRTDDAKNGVVYSQLTNYQLSYGLTTPATLLAEPMSLDPSAVYDQNTGKVAVFINHAGTLWQGDLSGNWVATSVLLPLDYSPVATRGWGAPAQTSNFTFQTLVLFPFGGCLWFYAANLGLAAPLAPVGGVAQGMTGLPCVTHNHLQADGAIDNPQIALSDGANIWVTSEVCNLAAGWTTWKPWTKATRPYLPFPLNDVSTAFVSTKVNSQPGYLAVAGTISDRGFVLSYQSPSQLASPWNALLWDAPNGLGSAPALEAVGTRLYAFVLEADLPSNRKVLVYAWNTFGTPARSNKQTGNFDNLSQAFDDNIFKPRNACASVTGAAAASNMLGYDWRPYKVGLCRAIAYGPADSGFRPGAANCALTVEATTDGVTWAVVGASACPGDVVQAVIQIPIANRGPYVGARLRVGPATDTTPVYWAQVEFRSD